MTQEELALAWAMTRYMCCNTFSWDFVTSGASAPDVEMADISSYSWQ